MSTPASLPTNQSSSHPIPITNSQQPPNHPPLSPSQAKSLSPKLEGFVTPNCSPPSHPTTPVIVTNPNFLPPPPLLPRYSPYHPIPVIPPKPSLGSRLPPPSGRWDNTTTTPSYHKPDQEFWSTRQFPIPILSTVSSALSGLGFTPGSSQSSEVFDAVQLEQVDLATSETMTGKPSDMNDAAEADRLNVIWETVEYKISYINYT